MANKQLLQSAGDGTAVPAGYVGEVRNGTIVSVTHSGINTYSSSSCCTFSSVTPGVYLLIANIPARPGTRPTVGTVGSSFRISGSISGAIIDIPYSFIWSSAAANSDIGTTNIALHYTVTVTTTQTLSVFPGILDYSGGSTGAPTFDAAFSSLGFGQLIRIA